MIEAVNLTKSYGKRTAVNHLNFQLEEGKIYGFLGPNGAGKSTTMNMMTGYIASSEGTVIINGHDILEEAEEAKKCLGYLPEQPPLYVDMTVYEYLNLAAELKKVPKNQRAEMIEEIMELVQITDMKDRLIKNLSKGYKQRTGLAQAIMGYPEILILDEPTVGLDPKQIIEIRDLIKKLGQKHTVILSSHILSEVSAVCDEIMILSHGNLVASDTAENLARRLAGENTLDLTLLTDVQTVEEVMNSIEGIAEWSVESGMEGTVQVNIRTKDDKDIRLDIFNKCVEFGCPILGMERKTVSLEDIFLELTAQEEEPHENNL